MDNFNDGTQFALLDLIGGFGNPSWPTINDTLQVVKTVMTPECAANALSMVSQFSYDAALVEGSLRDVL